MSPTDFNARGIVANKMGIHRYRNEATDATHLAEFHQVEGVVADYDINLGHLIGKWKHDPINERMTRLKLSQFLAMMETFFRKTGNNKLRFKPAFNPYTEPSMEIFSYHEGLKRWIEVGNVSLHCSLAKTRLRLIFSRSFSRECSDRKCWSPWVCLRVSESLDGECRWNDQR